jgi:branched-chain amino acid transport system substrate-binding protein
MRLNGILIKTLLILTATIAATGRPEASSFSDDPGGKINIGILVQDSGTNSAIRGAELAVKKANEKGGMNGRPFQLKIRTMEGPWGTGSKQAVSLVFDEKVWALIGSHDGRNAHLVEQAATKSTVVFLSAWAGDPTLSQAFVPWFFNCVPNDLQQAGALVNEIYLKRKIRLAVVVYDNDYDSKQSMGNFLKKTTIDNMPAPILFSFENFSSDVNILSNKINESGAECIILFCNPLISRNIFLAMRKSKHRIPVFGPLFLLNEDLLSEKDLTNYNGDLMIPSEDWSESKAVSFRKEFIDKYGTAPGAVAAYAYDGMTALINAIMKAGVNDREKIQEALSEIEFEGVTGQVQFDKKGNRAGVIHILDVNNGFPVTPGRN